MSAHFNAHYVIAISVVADPTSEAGLKNVEFTPQHGDLVICVGCRVLMRRFQLPYHLDVVALF